MPAPEPPFAPPPQADAGIGAAILARHRLMQAALARATVPLAVAAPGAFLATLARPDGAGVAMSRRPVADARLFRLRAIRRTAPPRGVARAARPVTEDAIGVRDEEQEPRPAATSPHAGAEGAPFARAVAVGMPGAAGRSTVSPAATPTLPAASAPAAPPAGRSAASPATNVSTAAAGRQAVEVPAPFPAPPGALLLRAASPRPDGAGSAVARPQVPNGRGNVPPAMPLVQPLAAALARAPSLPSDTRGPADTGLARPTLRSTSGRNAARPGSPEQAISRPDSPAENVAAAPHDLASSSSGVTGEAGARAVAPAATDAGGSAPRAVWRRAGSSGMAPPAALATGALPLAARNAAAGSPPIAAVPDGHAFGIGASPSRGAPREVRRSGPAQPSGDAGDRSVAARSAGHGPDLAIPDAAPRARAPGIGYAAPAAIGARLRRLARSLAGAAGASSEHPASAIPQAIEDPPAAAGAGAALPPVLPATSAGGAPALARLVDPATVPPARVHRRTVEPGRAQRAAAMADATFRSPEAASDAPDAGGGGSGPGALVQRAAAAAATPAGAPAPSSAGAADRTAPAGAATPAPDADALADSAWRMLMDRLLIEQERRGYTLWR